MRDPGYAASDSRLRRVGSRLDVAEERLGVRPHRGQLAAHVASGPQAIVGGQPFVRVRVAKRHLAGPCKCVGRFARPIAARRDQRVAESDVHLPSLTGGVWRFSPFRLVRHRKRLAEMRDGLLEGGSAKRLVAGLAPPFDRQIVEPSPGEVMGDRLRFGGGMFRLFAQNFGSATMQNLPPALEQTVIRGILDQRVLEAVGGGRRGAVDQQEIGFHEPIQRGL